MVLSEINAICDRINHNRLIGWYHLQSQFNKDGIVNSKRMRDEKKRKPIFPVPANWWRKNQIQCHGDPFDLTAKRWRCDQRNWWKILGERSERHPFIFCPASLFSGKERYPIPYFVLQFRLRKQHEAPLSYADEHSTFFVSPDESTHTPVRRFEQYYPFLETPVRY